MAYDPTLPVNNAPIVSAELRNQFAGLKELIDECATPGSVEIQITNETSGSIEPVANLSMAVSNPPTQAEVQAIADKIDEMIDYMRRV